MSLAIVTSGYLNVVILVIALYLAIKGGKVLPIPLDNKKEISPIILLNVERLLAIALAVGVFAVAMVFVFAPMFSATNLDLTAITP